jgi:hypothetical protein
MGIGDIVIHIDEDLNDDRIHELERQLSGDQGVYSACMHEKTRHLMVVDFDPDEIRPSSIVQAVRGRGLHAQMLGL